MKEPTTTAPSATQAPLKVPPNRNRVWIELEKPRDDEHAEHLCSLANNMLIRLSGSTPLVNAFCWDVAEQTFCYGGDMGYHNITDRSYWFNLDFLGRADL